MIITYFTLLIIAIPCVFLILYLIYRSGLSSQRKEQGEINSKAINQVIQSKFQYTKIFYITDQSTINHDNFTKKQILINDQAKQICFIDYVRKNVVLVPFNEILDYKIYENNDTVTTGAHAGIGIGLFSAQTTGMCKNLQLIIQFNQYNHAQLTYDIIFDSYLKIGINKSTKTYKECISSLQEIMSFLEVIKNENNKNK